MIGTKFWRGTRLTGWRRWLAAGAAATALIACGPGLDSLAPFSIGGTVTGLTGTLVLQNNGGDNLSLTGNGSFKFSKELLADAAYAVTVLTPSPGQDCLVSAGSGSATADVTTIAVQCLAPWAGTKQLGVASYDTEGSAVATDASGNVYVTGNTTGPLAGNSLAGSTDLFLTKYDRGGVVKYTKQLGAFGANTFGRSVAVDASGNVYVAGNTTRSLPGNTLSGTTDVFFAKYNSLGDQQFIRQLGAGSGTNTHGLTIAIDPNGNIYVAGDTDGNLDGIATRVLTSSTYAFVTKYDSAGNLKLTKQFGVDQKTTSGTSVATYLSNGIVSVFVAGHTNVDLATTAGLSSTANPSGSAAASTGAVDYFVTKFDDQLANPKTVQLGAATATTNANSLAIDASGNVFVAGSTSGRLDGTIADAIGTTDFFFTKYDNNLNPLQTVQLGLLSTDSVASSVATDTSGNIYVAGYTNGYLVDSSRTTSTGAPDFFVAKYNSNGVNLYFKQVGVALKETFGKAVATDFAGNVFVAGSTTGGLDNIAAQNGFTDAFVTKYNNTLDKQ